MADEDPNTPDTSPEGAPESSGQNPGATPDSPDAGAGSAGDAAGGSSLDDAVSQAAEGALDDAEQSLTDLSDQMGAAAETGAASPDAIDDLLSTAEQANAIAAEAEDSASGAGGGGAGMGVQPVDLPSFTSSFGGESRQQIDLLSDVDLDVSIELGRTRMLVEDVLRLDEGVVVELDKLAGDPVDVYVNNRLVARGEVLVLNDNFCVRVNEILSPLEEDPNGE